MVSPAYVHQHRSRPPMVAWPVPRPRRFTVVLGSLASLGVAGTSFRPAPLGLLAPLLVVWLAAFAAGGLWSTGGPVVLVVLAAAVKAVTAVLVVWALTHPHSGLGPHDAADWVPLGMLNAATGLWVLRVIRHQAH